MVGFLVARLLWLGLAPLFESPALTRTNYRGATLPTAAGIVLALAALVVEAGRAVAGLVRRGRRRPHRGPGSSSLVAVLGYGVLGLVDDVAGLGRPQGLPGPRLGPAVGPGHQRAAEAGRRGGGGAGRGRPAGGASRRAGWWPTPCWWPCAANLANLLDRAPGRTTKAGGRRLRPPGARAWAAPPALVPVAVVVGAALGPAARRPPRAPDAG